MQIDTITAAATTEEDALLLGRVAAGDSEGRSWISTAATRRGSTDSA
jgi:hypothetical protein